MAISKAQRTAHGAVSQAYQLLPPLSDDEFASLKADIAKHGILVAVELDEHGHLLDGHHRVRAWQELRSEGVRVPDFPRVIRAGLTDAEKRAHVRAVNLVRRHLSAAQRRAIIADALREDASQSDRQIASMLGVSHPTVAAVRRELEGRGDVERFTTRMDVLGRSQPVRHPTITVSSSRDERRALAALATLGNDAPGRFLTVRRAESLAREVQLERRRNGRGRKVVQGRDWEIRHGDFRLALNDVADESVDLVLTDPPYGDDALPLWSDLAELSARVLKPGRVLVALTGQRRLAEVIGRLTDHVSWVWLGMIPRSGAASPTSARGLRIDSRFIPVVVLSAGRYEPRGYFLDVVKPETKVKGLKAEHPWEQPVGPFLELVEAFSKPGELVLDPLCGTGTTGVAALRLGRQFLGVDKDKAAVSLAIERLSAR
jgi:ParB-like chromosome segregation protein Spo0J